MYLSLSVCKPNIQMKLKNQNKQFDCQAYKMTYTTQLNKEKKELYLQYYNYN
ncbi:hypothetical protein TTHERM_000592702 (macronuclear) [Tetrahymena thermophila SB210]|uniref:Uncharacterized protein n=1 Tax=Tetrahymena thermophila (strain SB210) TaxID=312017 RepID=W7X862_TETTS|nr:hypothetical protein TTHERM_000592702 [Tetrahymena thermophila SB210]EWS75565.1 hypothetical protein TTHERM_000592702 [Tetrahymena thermophila SB210]|eukprot:XP_012651865.1 hypothetical protein TTHERM_000592702 [Tetrahymena thermophila SB210]